jgi:hypothetical protein
MDLYMSETGRTVKPEFPTDLAPWPELAEAVENARRVERGYQEALAAHSAGEAALKTSIGEDRARLAEAKLKGAKAMPKPDGVQAAKTALEEAERQRNASDDARRRASQIVLETLEAHRAEYIGVAEAAVERARADEATALKAYLETVAMTTVARETLAWIRDFPTKRSFRPTTGHLQHVGRRDGIPFSELAHGLEVRAGLADPPPRSLKEHVEAAGLVPSPLIGGPAKEGTAA